MKKRLLTFFLLFGAVGVCLGMEKTADDKETDHSSTIESNYSPSAIFHNLSDLRLHSYPTFCDLIMWCRGEGELCEEELKMLLQRGLLEGSMDDYFVRDDVKEYVLFVGGQEKFREAF